MSVKEMIKINNSELTKEIREGARTQSLVSNVPDSLNDVVMPVMEVNPKLLKYANVVRHVSTSVSGTNTIYTAPTDKDFYLTSACIGIIKDAACDLPTGVMALAVVTEENGTFNPISIPTLLSTAQFETITATFNTPIKIKKGTNITFSGTFTAGACSRVGCITGYTIDNINA